MEIRVGPKGQVVTLIHYERSVDIIVVEIKDSALEMPLKQLPWRFEMFEMCPRVTQEWMMIG